MADEHGSGGGSALEDLIFVVGFIVVLVVLWVYTGGPSRADLRGIFIHPPAPVGQGGAYGPQIGTLSTSSISAPVALRWLPHQQRFSAKCYTTYYAKHLPPTY